MNALEAAILFLSDAVPGVSFMAPLETDEQEGAIFPASLPLCLVGLAGEGLALQGSGRMQNYSLRFYGPDDPAILDAYETTRRGCFFPLFPWIPLSQQDIGDWHLDLVTIGNAAGPIPEPSTDRRVLLAQASIKWRM